MSKRVSQSLIRNNDLVQKAKSRLYDLSTGVAQSDPEVAHGEADKILCELLTGLGYQDVVEMYNSIPKWYA